MTVKSSAEDQWADHESGCEVLEDTRNILGFESMEERGFGPPELEAEIEGGQDSLWTVVPSERESAYKLLFMNYIF